MILVTMKSEGLTIECPQSSIPVFDEIIGCSKFISKVNQTIEYKIGI
jgi:hypothetical protein